MTQSQIMNNHSINALEIDLLCKRFSQFHLQDISFSIPSGSIMGLIGENGAGKTTIIKLILNQIKKDSGTISVFGKEHLACEQEIKQDIGVVLDEGFFYEGLHALQISTILSKVFRNWDQPLFLSYLDHLQVPTKQEFKVLSKGTKMKLSIACALAHHPKLLLLDEPTSGLDPVIRKDILDLFQDFIQDEQHTILMSSHITEDLEKITDYITFIHRGSVMISAPTTDILESYGIIKCGKERFSMISKDLYLGFEETAFGFTALTANRTLTQKQNQDLLIEPAKLEDIMVFYHGRKE